MARIWEGKYAGFFIVSEANKGGTMESRSRDQFHLRANNMELKVGQVVVSGTQPNSLKEYESGDGVVGIMFDNALQDENNTQEIVLITRDCEVNGAELFWDAASEADILVGVAALEAKGIIVRS